jgi:hypothetical protein
MPMFYHITLTPRPGVSRESIRKKMDLALNWFRYTDTTWVVYTNSNSAKWCERLKELVVPEGTLFVCRLDITERQGWMTTQFWEWLHAIIKETDK